MTPEDEAECRRVVLDYATSLNDWEVRRYAFDRLAAGRHVRPAKQALVAGLTNEALVRQHEALFARCIVPRERKLGSNPGVPASIGRDGRFFDVAPTSVLTVRSRNHNTVEVTTGWGYLLPGGETLFVLKGGRGSLVNRQPEKPTRRRRLGKRHPLMTERGTARFC